MEEPGQTPRTSKAAAAGVIFAIVWIPVATIGWAARQTDQDWLWPVGAVTAVTLTVCCVVSAGLGLALIAGSRGQLRGYAWVVVALVMGLGQMALLALVGLAQLTLRR